MTHYFVSLCGSDRNPGTQALPFRTVQKAASVAVAGDTVYLRGNPQIEAVYRETVIPANSGTECHPIVYKAYRNEKVCISGTELIPEEAWTIRARLRKWNFCQSVNMLKKIPNENENLLWSGLWSGRGKRQSPIAFSLSV